MERNGILEFLKAVDAEMTRHAGAGQRLDLYLIGRAALILRYGLVLATKDVDMVARMAPQELEAKALQLFGEGSANAERLGLYLQGVPQGLPPLPQSYCQQSTDVPGDWRVLRPKEPEPHNLAATKLKRFHAKDREDLRIMCDAGDLTAEGLEGALDSAYAFGADEEEDPGRKRAYQNLRQVQGYLQGKAKAL